MRSQKLVPTTKTVDDLYQLYIEGRLDLRPDYQRNSVWPPKARAYLVDTILKDRPIPMLFLSRTRDSNTNKMGYRVIDGQQRLRAAFAFLENRFGANESQNIVLKGKRFKRLPVEYQDQFMGYNFVVMEMSGYNDEELRDIFARINRYVVRLNQQELRDAQKQGPFKAFIDDIAKDEVWSRLNIFSKTDVDRKRDKEFLAELAILKLDGPQDKKGSVDLYYAATKDQFEDADLIKADILKTAKISFGLIAEEVQRTYLKLPAFYGLMGSLYEILENEDIESKVVNEQDKLKTALLEFAKLIEALPPNPEDFQTPNDLSEEIVRNAYRFKESVSRQTDNIKPRSARIEVLKHLFRSTLVEH